MAKMSKGEINKSMINFLTFNKNLSEMMINSCPNLIKKLCGKKLLYNEGHTLQLMHQVKTKLNNGRTMK